MSDPFIGEIRAFGFHFAPTGWALCDGRLLPLQQYAALFSIIGTYYGGNGTTTFGLPNLQNAAPMHWGNGAGLTPTQIGQVQGQPSVTLQIQQLPPHNHMIQSAQAGAPAQIGGTPGPTVWLGDTSPAKVYNPTNSLDVAFSPKAIGYQGGSQAHNNVQPLLAVNICIALNGIFPSRG